MATTSSTPETNVMPMAEPVEQPPQPSKKMWGSVETPSSAKTSLASIMAEETTKSQQEKHAEREKKLQQQEEAELQLVMEASMADASSKPSAAEVGVEGLDEDMRLAIALSLKESEPTAAAAALPTESQEATSSVARASTDNGLSAEEAEQIEKALREADKTELDESLSLAMQLQNEEDQLYASSSCKRRDTQSDGHVRIMTRQELQKEQASLTSSSKVGIHDYDDDEEEDGDVGFRMNSSTPSKEWSRLDRATIVGPNQEVRTKHDVELHGRANAHRLGLLEGDDHFVGNRAYNSFKQSMQRKTNKGVAAHGHGRATADTDKTKQGGMDSRVRTQIAKAINSGLIEVCNGVVKEGKEAIVYHANEGAESGGYDVAVKVFKRIQEFKDRYAYVDGDPRYLGRKFNNAGSREQLEIWAEKEHRNLVRANRGGVPVPTPLLQKENLLFMRFLGQDGWPSPQLKELNLKKGSKKWTTLYSQSMDAIQRLYHKGRLVHGDLSEYNIMVCPSHLVENRDKSNDGDKSAVQVVLIDFGQAVDQRHPSALELLQRDILRVKQFFDKMGVKTMTTKEAEEFVLSWDYESEEEEEKAAGQKDDLLSKEAKPLEKEQKLKDIVVSSENSSPAQEMRFPEKEVAVDDI